MPDEVVHFLAQAVAHLLVHGFVVGQVVSDLVVVVFVGVPVDFVGFHYGHFQAVLG